LRGDSTAGVKPARSSFSRTNASAWSKHHAGFEGVGTAGSSIGRKAQSFAGSVSGRWAWRWSAAPLAIHRTRISISSSGSFWSGGISCPSYRIAETSKLSSGLVATIAGPLEPPICHPDFESRTSPPLALPAAWLWHPRQRCSRMGRTRSTKNASGSSAREGLGEHRLKTSETITALNGPRRDTWA